MRSNSTPYCIGCHKTPEEIDEYIHEAALNEMTPTEFVLSEEGTLNPANNHFTCTECYIGMGQPSGPGGWVAP